MACVLVPQTAEIVTQSLYAGNPVSCSVFKEMVAKMEDALQLETQEKRKQIRLRLDAGFGTDENINFALWRGYHLLVKLFSGKRPKKLAKSVSEWVDAPSAANRTQRQAGWVTKPHRYGRKTAQVAVRTPSKNGTYTDSVLVTTCLHANPIDIVTDYDQRPGVPESRFCQDYQGLSLRKRRKGSFVAQQRLVLLSQLAHNLVVWAKSWLSNALEEALFVGEGVPNKSEAASILGAIKTIEERGMKRFLRQILSLKGKVIFKRQQVVGILLNPLYPLISRIKTALEAFLKPYKIWVSLDER
ncbi:transposase [Candidatus Poribacteria bacterium]|nr:transposase [Candidatus Poribacteria bacterium]